MNYEGAEIKRVNNQEAKEVLMLFRPGVVDESDPGFAEALTVARQRRKHRGRQERPRNHRHPSGSSSGREKIDHGACSLLMF